MATDVTNQKVTVPVWDIPMFRQKIAKAAGVEKKLAFVTYGGLGDVLCAEPTIRYALEVLKPALKIESITVVTRFPDLFKHLDVATVQTDEDGKVEMDRAEYHYLYCGHPDTNLQHVFFTHNSMMPVDYPALSALRQQLPLNYRYIKTAETPILANQKLTSVVVHPGYHWKSKRFPKSWWDDVIQGLIDQGLDVTLIGGKPNYEYGTVDVNTDSEFILDLRCKLTLAESADLLRHASVLISNDSFPVHLATIGNAHIGFLATAKDPEWLYHWRKTPDDRVEFAWRMQNLALGGSYQRSYTPQAGGNHLSEASQEEVRSWLPHPSVVYKWAADKILGRGLEL